eukprot:764018-Hanusia_phi.AAC.3
MLHSILSFTAFEVFSPGISSEPNKNPRRLEISLVAAEMQRSFLPASRTMRHGESLLLHDCQPEVCCIDVGSQRHKRFGRGGMTLETGQASQASLSSIT